MPVTDTEVAVVIFGVVLVAYLLRRDDSDEDESHAPGRRLERDCEETLRSLGWHILPLPKSHDVGADVHARKNRHTLIVQCKDLKRPAGIKAVQQAHFAGQAYGADFQCVVASSGFSRDAERHARNNNVELLADLDDLKAYARRVNR